MVKSIYLYTQSLGSISPSSNIACVKKKIKTKKTDCFTSRSLWSYEKSSNRSPAKKINVDGS